ncbi:MAG TPA: hypothetical protein VH575_10810 [Gemmataceae bacterium]|jgi:hypothetical protein
MKLRHATPTRNLRSIRRRGLLTAKSQCKQPVVWLHAANRSAWAALHTMKRHTSNNVVVVEVSVPRSWLTRSRTGLWFCARDIPPGRLGPTVAVEEDAA